MSTAIVQALMVTAELTGSEFTPHAARAFAADLSDLPEPQVLAALVRCRRELKGKLTLADVISRLDDGRPGPEVAWSIALDARDEAASVVWTPEIAAAWDVARPIMALGDEVGARMAFKEAYTAALQAARATHRPARWLLSEGFDKARRAQAVRVAIELGRRPDRVEPAGLALACETAPPLLLAGTGGTAGGLSPAGRAAIARFREALGVRKAENTATAPLPADELQERRRAAREGAAAYAESHGIKSPNNGERS